jgi:O-acetylserine/cysteine efflux transporter
LAPVVGIISAAWLLGERLSPQQIIGTLAVIVGLLVSVFGGLLKSALRKSLQREQSSGQVGSILPQGV